MTMVGVRSSRMVELMERSRWPWTNRKYVCIPVLDLEASIRVQFSVKSSSRTHFLSKYATMALTGVHLPSMTL